MQINKVNNSPDFKGHGAKSLGDVMNRLYREACMLEYNPKNGDIVQLTSRMRDGVEVSAIATFSNGNFVGMAFPKKFLKYKAQFCNKLFETYNNAVTKGKGRKIPRY